MDYPRLFRVLSDLRRVAGLSTGDGDSRGVGRRCQVTELPERAVPMARANPLNAADLAKPVLVTLHHGLFGIALATFAAPDAK